MRSGYSFSRRAAIAGLGLYLCLGVSLAVYWPGLGGIFLLDDIPNLSNLGRFDTLSGIDRFLLVVATSPSGVLGRPLAMASFFLNDYAWPSDPRAFLYTNLMLHLLNGCLVFWLTSLLTERLPRLSRFQSVFIPLVATALWLLHPLGNSTVLYVIQRMTELAGTCMLAGLIMYLKGRLYLAARPATGYVLMSVGMATGIGIGALSKEIAIMLPVYVLAAELLLRHELPVPVTRGWRAWRAVFIYLPLAFAVAWHAWAWESIAREYSLRAFSLPERLMTEARVVFDYLGGVLVPSRVGTGLFHDDVVVSASLTEPLSTAFAVAGLVLIVAAVWMARRRAPVAAFGVAWFLGGHLLEATVLPLELVFEHRNYLPMLGPLFAVAYYLSLLSRLTLRHFAVATALALVSLNAFATWGNATLWAQPLLLADTWAREHPSSIRAQTFAASRWALRGQPRRAKDILEALIERRPDAVSARLGRMMMECRLGMDIPPERLDSLATYLETAPKDTVVPASIRNLLVVKLDDGCNSVTLEDFERITNALHRNENYKSGKIKRNLFIVQADIAAAQGNYGKTVRALQNALQYEKHKVSISEILAYVHASAGDHQRALELLDRIEVQPIAGHIPMSQLERIEKLKEQIRSSRPDGAR